MKPSSASGPPCSGRAAARRRAGRCGGRLRLRGARPGEAPSSRNRRACGALVWLRRRPAMMRAMSDSTLAQRLLARRPPRAGARDHARRGRSPRGLAARARGLSAHRQRGDRWLHRPAGRGQVDADRRRHEAAARGRKDGRRAVDRSLLAVHPRRAAGRSDPPLRALSRPGRVHPLDGQPRGARRPVGGRAAGRAAARRRGAPGRAGRDDRGGPGRDRHHRPRRHGRAGADARVRRLGPGAQGRRDGDPRRDRRQQGRQPAHRHDGA